MTLRWLRGDLALWVKYNCLLAPSPHGQSLPEDHHHHVASRAPLNTAGKEAAIHCDIKRQGTGDKKVLLTESGPVPGAVLLGFNAQTSPQHSSIPFTCV